jgi:hypothetical protein
MPITCFIRYVIDPFKAAEFEEYARTWLTVIPKCGGDLLGYFMPHEGTNNIAIALVRFESLAAYESFRTTIKKDPEGMTNFQFAAQNQFILVEERHFLRQVAAS